MQNAVKVNVQSVLQSTRTRLLDQPSSVPGATVTDSESGSNDEDLFGPFDRKLDAKRQRVEGIAPPLSRPSEYLRSRCPICFGGTKFESR